MKYYLRRKKKVDECDSACVAQADSETSCDLSVGMGPVVIGGPDRFDNVIGSMGCITGGFRDMNVKKRIRLKKRRK